MMNIITAAVGGYSIVKGAYNMYRDAEKIKREYREQKEIAKQYKHPIIEKGETSPLTESTFQSFKDEFLLVNEPKQ